MNLLGQIHAGYRAPVSSSGTVSDDLPLLIDGGVRLRQCKWSDFDIKLFGCLIDHLIRTVHGPEWGSEGTARSVFKALPGCQPGLFANDARALYFFHFSHSVGDNPMAADELNGVPAFIGDIHGVEKKPLA